MFGEIESHAQMHIDDGIVTGSITISDETFHIEVSISAERNIYLHKLTEQYNKK